MSRTLTVRLVSVTFLLFGVVVLEIERVGAADRFWVPSTGGSFNLAANWSATDGGAGGAGIPGVGDIANFTLNNTYDVTFSASVTNTDLDIENGNVTFDLLGLASYTATSATAVAIGNTAGQTGRLTVLRGTLGVDTAGDDVQVGTTADSIGFLTVGTGGQLGVDATRPDVVVGNSGTGTLTVQSTGEIFASALTVGSQPFSTGTVNVTGLLASVDAAGTITIGSSGTGTMTLSGGADLAGISTLIGSATNSTGTITVTGSGSSWSQSGGMSVGGGGLGTLNVQAGGALATGSGTIGANSGAFGTATVTGNNSTWTAGSFLIVGHNGEGALTVSNGGRISTGTNLTIGNQAGSEGTATITGADSRVDVVGFIELGHDQSNGSLVISAGAHVTSNAGGLATFAATGTGEATITDAGSSWINTTDVNIGTTGTGTLTVRDGGNLTAGGTVNIGDPGGAPVGTLTLDGGTIDTGGFTRTGVFNFYDGTLHVKGVYDHGAAAAPLVIDGATPADSPTLRLSGNFAVNDVTSITVGSINRGALVLDGGRSVSIGANQLAIGTGILSNGSVAVSGNGSSLSTTGTIAVGGMGILSGGSGTLTIGAGSVVSSASLVLFNGGVVNLEGGRLVVGGLTLFGDEVNFNSGEIAFTTATNLSDSLLDALLGASHILSADQRLSTTSSSLTFEAPFTVSGGDVSAATSITNAGTMQIDAGSLTATTTLTNNSGQLLTVSGTATLLAGSGINNNGTMKLDDNLVATGGGTLTNNGTVRGSGLIGNSLTNNSSGQVQATTGKRLEFQASANTNSGSISFVGGEIVFTGSLTNSAGTGLVAGGDAILRVNGGLTNLGSLAVSFGNNNVFGDINNTGSVVVTGGAHATFYDDVTQNGTFIVRKIGSTTSTAVVLGAFTGAGGSSGGGDIFFEGDLRPGNSAATVNFANNITLGPAVTLQIELGGTTPGAQFDQAHVTGDLMLDGTLSVALINAFSPTAGNSFDILDWGTLAGTFATLELPPLGAGLMWNASQLYTLGSLNVALAGDYNQNGIVDAADYAVWRNTLGDVGTGLAADGDSDGTVDNDDYTVWRSHFGQTAASGAGATGSASPAVPEPAGFIMACCAVFGIATARRQSRASTPHS